MKNESLVSEYGFAYHSLPPHSSYIWDEVKRNLENIDGVKTILDAGCGNGSFVAELRRMGYDAFGIEQSDDRIEVARKLHGDALFKYVSVYEDYLKAFRDITTFDAIISLEVIEHLFSPSQFIERAHLSLKVGGVIILSTPYHGYFKNVILALSNKMDDHFTALWEGGHIKFWSAKTICKLLTDHGFKNCKVRGVGRFWGLWKSMVVTAIKKQMISE